MGSIYLLGDISLHEYHLYNNHAFIYMCDVSNVVFIFFTKRNNKIKAHIHIYKGDNKCLM